MRSRLPYPEAIRRMAVSVARKTFERRSLSLLVKRNRIYAVRSIQGEPLPITAGARSWTVQS